MLPLYSLAYGQVGPADASPVTWVRTMWMQLNGKESDVNGPNAFEEFREWGMGLDDVVVDELCWACNRSRWNFYRMAQHRVAWRINFLGGMPWCPMWLLLMGGAQLRRVLLYSQALVFSLLPFINALIDVADVAHLMTPTRVPSYFLEKCDTSFV